MSDQGQWESSEQFLTEKLRATEAEMGTAILNRTKWDKLRDDRRMLVYLQSRANAADFQGVREELNRISEGRIRVPDLGSPRTKAANCLALWTSDLQALEQTASPQ